MRGRRRILELNRATAGARAAFLHAATVVSQATGVAFGDIVAADRVGRPPRRRNSPAGFARRLAIYLANTALDVRQGALARATGRSKRRVHLCCRQVEEARDNPNIDALIERVEAML